MQQLDLIFQKRNLQHHRFVTHLTSYNVPIELLAFHLASFEALLSFYRIDFYQYLQTEIDLKSLPVEQQNLAECHYYPACVNVHDYQNNGLLFGYQTLGGLTYSVFRDLKHIQLFSHFPD